MTKTHSAKHSIHEIKANLGVVGESICSEKAKKSLKKKTSALYSQEY